MSTTGQLVHNELPISSSLTSTTLTLLALNVAISKAWPSVRLDEYYPSACTLDRDTFVYSMAPVTGLTDERAIIGKVYITEESTFPEVGHRSVRTRYDQSARVWSLIFADSLVNAYHGKVVNLQLQYPHARISAISDTIYLPHDYLVARVAVWYADYLMAEQSIDPGRWASLRAEWTEDFEKSLRANQTPALMPLMMTGSDRMPV